MFGQISIQDSSANFISITGKLGFQYPIGELNQRFGYGGITGGSVFYKTARNFTYEVGGDFFFGNQVKETSILSPILTEDNIIIDRTGNPAEVILYERGFIINAKVGKIFPVIGPNPNSGLHVAAGLGYMQHKIKVYEADELVPQLQGSYIMGYDRLTDGLNLTQSFGYQHFSNYRLWNYYIGIELNEGLTKNRRTVNYSTGTNNPNLRFDFLGSVVVKWYFPIYKRSPKDFYFY